MNEDMPWVNLTQEEVEELRNKKHKLTEYGKQQLRKFMGKHSEHWYDYTRNDPNRKNPFMNNEPLHATVSEEDYQKVLDAFKNPQPYPDEMFEEAERREAENRGQKVHQNVERAIELDKEIEEAMTLKPREEVMKIAIGAIDKYSDSLKELADIERAELIEELEKLKKENFTKVAECCIQEYEEKYDKFDCEDSDEPWIYMYSEYFGTGEGQTVCLMVTQALPHGDDFDPEDRYKTVTTKAHRAVREFHKQFGTWYLHGIRFLPKQEFYTQCAYYIPPVMMKLSNANCYKSFHTRVHYNFS